MIAFAKPEPDACAFEEATATCEVIQCPCCVYEPSGYTLTISGLASTPIQFDVTESQVLELLKNLGVTPSFASETES